jgi:hypothetical protein
MPVYRCDWCGRFYSSPLPEGSACDEHIHEHNERHSADIARFNERLKCLRSAGDQGSAGDERLLG